MTDTNPMNIPSVDTIESASGINVLDSKGNKVPFGDLISSSKTIVVFIRRYHPIMVTSARSY